MLVLEQTKTFKKCLKKYRHKKAILKELESVVELLLQEQLLPVHYMDHALKGKYQGFREVHLRPDDLLIYYQVKNQKLTLVALGSHSELF